jgi:hypothetical protein
VQRLLLEGALDPQMAAQLLRQKMPKAPPGFVESLLARSRPVPYAGLLGANVE